MAGGKNLTQRYINMLWSILYNWCTGMRWGHTPAKTLDDVIDDLERLPREEFKKLLKVYVMQRMEETTSMCCR